MNFSFTVICFYSYLQIRNPEQNQISMHINIQSRTLTSRVHQNRRNLLFSYIRIVSAAALLDETSRKQKVKCCLVNCKWLYEADQGGKDCTKKFKKLKNTSFQMPHFPAKLYSVFFLHTDVLLSIVLFTDIFLKDVVHLQFRVRLLTGNYAVL